MFNAEDVLLQNNGKKNRSAFCVYPSKVEKITCLSKSLNVVKIGEDPSPFLVVFVVVFRQRVLFG